ncbi:MAG: transcriptional regulator [Chloroflexales bacterium]|nr:transcriptional regulator [Chloroflexales bacterium]
MSRDTQRAAHAASFAVCEQIAEAIARTFGDICEVVIHDFANIEHSVTFIAGNVTGRAVGDGPTDLLLRAVRARHTEQDLYGYTGHTLDGKTLRSSSVFLRDEAGAVYGAFCINVDVTHLAQVEGWLARLLHAQPGPEVSETFTRDMSEALEVMLAEAALEIGVPVAHMNRAQKIELVQLLAERGAFRIKKAVTLVAERLGVSRFTVYNYLNASGDAEE